MIKTNFNQDEGLFLLKYHKTDYFLENNILEVLYPSATVGFIIAYVS